MKILTIVKLLFTVQCATVSVLHTKMNSIQVDSDSGKYFVFDENDFTKMVGEKDWNAKTYEVIQQGSKNWTGTIIIWNKGPYGSHGRRHSGGPKDDLKKAKAGDWAQGDTIQLKSCGKAGI